MNWVGKLLSQSDDEADSLVLGAMLCILAFVFVSIYTAVIAPQTFSAGSFGGGAAAILGAFGAGKGCRDKLAPPQQ